MRVPQVCPHGSLVGPRLYPHRALLIPNCPCGSHEVPSSLPTWFLVVPMLYLHYGNPPVFVSGDPAGSLWDKLPMWFPWGSLKFTHMVPLWFPGCTHIVLHSPYWQVHKCSDSSKPSTFWLQQWKIFHKVQTMTSAYFSKLHQKPSFQMWPNKKVVTAF